jgi:nucleoside-diphosphate-sugar epimerase
VVLITGASGFLGKALRRRLDPDYDVVPLDLQEDDDGTIACDLTDDTSLRAALQRVREEHGATLAAVVHLAAYYSFSDEPHPLYQKLNVGGTRALLDALNGGFTVERFIFAGTMLVHAPSEPGLPIDEEAPIDPTWVYPQSKWQAEEVIRRHRGAVPVALLRLAGVYTDDCGLPTLAHQIQRIYEQTPTAHLYAGALDRGQAFLHVDDLMRAFMQTLERRRELPEVFTALIGEPEVMSYRALQNLIARCLGHPDWHTFRAPGPIARLGARMNLLLAKLIPDSIDKGEEPFIKPFMIDRANDHFELDVSHARSVLGWRPEQRLRDHVPRMIDRLLNDPQRFYQVNKLTTPLWLDELGGRSSDPGTDLQRLRRRDARLHYQNRWSYLAAAALGAWLLLDGFAWGAMEPGLAFSNALSGVAIIVLAALCYASGGAAFRWLAVAAGMWVAFAPLVFFAANSASYLAGTLIGGMVMLFAAALPPEPGAGVNAALDTQEKPTGWSYNPSVWRQRAAIVALAFVGLFISRYLAAFQLGHNDRAWDPFFGTATEQIVTSAISEAWPVSDAGLGGFVYLLEIVLGIIGGRSRWRTMPWLVLMFGVLIVPLGAVSIYFIIIQPILLGTWCTLCLVAAAAMTIQIPLVLDEVAASLQFLSERRRAGRPLLWVLLRGDDGGSPARLPRAPQVAQRFQGLTLTWTLLVSIFIGMVLIGVRMSVGETALANANHLLGALIVTVSVASLAELGRPLRLINVLLGLALIAAPFLFVGAGLPLTALNVLFGVALIALAIPRGTTRNRYGVWDTLLGRSSPATVDS